MVTKVLPLVGLLLLIGFPVASLDFDGREYVFTAYYDDIQNPGFRMSFSSGRLFMDIPELDQGKNEEGIYTKGTTSTTYEVRENGVFTHLVTPKKTYAVLESKDGLVCILIDLSTNDSFWGVLKNSEFVRLGSSPRRNWIGITGSSVTSSSFLTERLAGVDVKYDGTGTFYYALNKWVEGKRGPGLGEWLAKAVPKKTKRVVVLNGFVDPKQPDLYTKNARVRNCVIETSAGRWVFELEDTPNPQILNLPVEVEGTIKLVIQDVYPGSKYEDTTISGLYFLVSP